MASGTRSSKRKSSPSLKKKRRTKDLSKKRRKIRKGKSKKVSRREGPDSYSDNESLSSASSVSYSSTDSGSRRSRSRTRKDTSKRRKKSRGSRLRSKSIENAINERRGKRSKKSKDTDAKKKRLRKKRRREPSISSSSRSVSCSTCRSSEDGEREHQKTEKGVKRRGRSRRDLGEDRRWRRGHSRSRSPSFCRLDGGDGSYLSEEQRLVENNPRRLRSIIIFAKEFEEEEEEKDTELIDRDVHKEEIIYDRDDYPSPRSNDSHDGDDPRKETSPESTGDLENQRAKMVGSKIGISELSEACHLGLVEHGVNASASDGADVGDSFEGHEANVSSANAGSNHADLEAVLRQKALENLKKFKGGMRANAKKHVSTKRSCDVELKQSSGLVANSELQKKDQEGSVGGVGILSVPHQNMSTVDRHSSRTMEESSALNGSAAEILPILPQDLKMVNPSNKEGTADVDRLEGGEGEASALKEGNFGADKFTEEALPTQEPPLTNMLTTESLSLASRDDKGLTDSADGVKDKHEAGASGLMQRLGSNNPDSQMISTEESSMPMSVPTQSKDTVESVQPSHDTKMVTDDVQKTATGVVPTSLASNLEGQSSNAQGKEDGDSQFQQKTMSVMRGGEMVQVSYKVYIPKHVPALARRKLKR